jgi:biotin carboxylase
MYGPVPSSTATEDPRQVYVAEQFIPGREYSCDFTVENGVVKIIRIAKKLPAESEWFGTTLGYIVPAKIPGELRMDRFASLLAGAAEVLGLSRSLCMVDFVVDHGQPVLLEMTPRPGGDCLPALIRNSCGLDMLRLTLDFAEGNTAIIPSPDKWRTMIGLRLFADRSGVVAQIGPGGISEDPRVCEFSLIRSPGDEVCLPPEDYDSWLLGYVVFRPDPDLDIREQCVDLRSKLTFRLENGDHERSLKSHVSPGRATSTTHTAA